MSIEDDIVEELVVDEGDGKQTNPITDQQPEPEVAKEPPPEEKPEDPPIPKGVQKRIDRAVRQKYEAEARAKMLEERLAVIEQRQFQQNQPSIDKSEPKIENFDNFDTYVAAKAEWIASKKIEETLTEREKRQKEERENHERQQVQTTWAKRVSEATVEMPDFEEVLASSEVPMTGPMQDAIMESDIGPKLAYFLANNPDEAIKIANMPPISAIRALGRIEERLQTQPVKKPTSAPEPIKPVGARATVKKNPGQMSDAEYAKWRKQGRA
jgi:hypothetical protein